MHDLYSLLSGLAKPERRKQFLLFCSSFRKGHRPRGAGWVVGGGEAAPQVDPSNYALGQRAALGRRQRMESIT